MSQGRPTSNHDGSQLLTEVELVIMRTLWSLQVGTVKQVLEALPKSERRKITTVATMLKILEEKGFASSVKQARSLVFKAGMSLHDYQQIALRRQCADLFDGSTTRMLERCLSTFQLDQTQLGIICESIDEKRSRSG